MHPMREKMCAARPVPAGLAADVAGYEWARDRIGQSGTAVYRLHDKPGTPAAFLKHGEAALAADIIDEMVRLQWLARHLPVPAVLRSVTAPGEAWLLTAALPGETAYQILKEGRDARMATVDALALFLRRLHAIPVSDCPFVSDHIYRLARARERLDAGLVDEGDFEDERQGWTGEQVWDALQQLLPLAPDPVVAHGDFSLDNILIADGGVEGCIDVGRVGIADRYQDIAIVWNNLGAFDPSLQDRFLARYGIEDVDRHKIEFHLLLDEMF